MIAANSASSSYEVRMIARIDALAADLAAHVDSATVTQPGVEDRHIDAQGGDPA